MTEQLELEHRRAKPLACGSAIIVEKNGRLYKYHEGFKTSFGELIPESWYPLSLFEEQQSRLQLRKGEP